MSDTSTDSRPAHRRPRPRRLRRLLELERRRRAPPGGRGRGSPRPPNPLRGISHDSAYVASFIEQIPGPVLAVGHSYGGAVISNAATGAENVVGLVFVAAFAPDEGERLGEVDAPRPRTPSSSTALVPLQYPTGNGEETAVEFAIDPDEVPRVFAADLPAEQAAVMAATQRPVAELGVLGAVGHAGLEVAAVLDRARTGTSRPAPTWSGRWPSAPARRSPRSRART